MGMEINVHAFFLIRYKGNQIEFNPAGKMPVKSGSSSSTGIDNQLCVRIPV